MRTAFWLVLVLLAGGSLWSVAQAETFYGYVDSGFCSRVMLGQIDTARVSCSEKTAKQGADLVVVRLDDRAVFEVDKRKKVKELVGQTVKVTGEIKEKPGKIKIETIEAVPTDSIPKGEAGVAPLDVRTYRTDGQNRTYEQVRKTLAMMPYITDFDFISFTMTGDNVILSGWTVRITNRSEAYNRVKNIEGVGNIVNNIEVLPMGRMDMQVRAGARLRMQRFLPMYFWGSGSAIKIIVKNGTILLLGVVNRQADADLANIQCNSVPGAFQVYNLLRVAPDQGKEKKQ